MTCVVCHGELRGFTWSNPRKPTRHPLLREAVGTCSMRCLDAYTRLMTKTEGRTVDTSDMEQAAHAAALPPLGEFVAGCGMDRPLAAYSREEILELVAVVVAAYREHLVVEHERLAERDRAYFRQHGVPF